LLICNTKVRWFPKKKKERIEIFNFNSDDGQKEYKKILDNENTLTKCFETSDSFQDQCNKWFKQYMKIVKRSFKKIKITNKQHKGDIAIKIQHVKEIKKKLSNAIKEGSVLEIQNIKDELKYSEDEVAKICALKNKELIEEHVQGLSNEDGEFRAPKMWKLKNKVIKKSSDSPSAKKDDKGNLITSHHLLKNLYEDTYIKRLEHREMSPDLSELKDLKEKLFDLRLGLAKNKPSMPWSEENLIKVLKSLKKNKARDPWDLIYELFRPELAGNDLTKSLLQLFNGMKKHLFAPDFLLLANITSIYKNKGERTDLNNDRGIFGLVKIRNIFDKLMYNDIYPIIDNNMSDSNIGARQHRNIRDHLFVVNGIINDVVNGNGHETDLQIFDIQQCFDSMWLRETLNDMFDSDINNDYLSLLFETNKKCDIAIKTPVGLTQRKEVNEVIMQGGIFGGLQCALQTDLLGKECLETGNSTYKYKESLDIPPLGYIDDVAGMSQCNVDSIKLNVKTEETIKSKKLKLNEEKCHIMHIGKQKLCPHLQINKTEMKHVQYDKYLGQYVASNGSNEKNIDDKYSKGIGMSCQVHCLLSELSLGNYYFHIGLLLRDTNIVNVILFGSEALYGVTKKQINILESVDLNFMRKLFNANLNTAKEAFYLETGKLPIKFILINRRLMFWRHILNSNRNGLLFKFYTIQKASPVRNDWVTQIETDRKEIILSLSDEDVVGMSKWKFKRLVKNRVTSSALMYLNNIANTHSKSLPLTKNELKCEEYINDRRFTVDEIQLLFQLRTRMYPVKENMKNKYKNDLSCEFCKLGNSNQQHQLKCAVLVKFVPELANRNIKYSHIFGPVNDQLAIVKIFSKITKQREILLEALSIK
jgi:hypothetical protein